MNKSIEVQIHGKSYKFTLDVNEDAYIYTDEARIAENDAHIVIGIHDSNPGCYPYLDHILVIDKKTGAYKQLRKACLDVLTNKDGRDVMLQTVKYEDGQFIISDGRTSAIVNIENIMAEDIKAGTGIMQETDPDKLSTYFKYEVCHDMGILIMLKPAISRQTLLRWPGFGLNYNGFKLWGNLDNAGYMMFIDTDRNYSEVFHYSRLGDTAHMQRRELINCIKTVMPNHPAIREQLYFTVL